MQLLIQRRTLISVLLLWFFFIFVTFVKLYERPFLGYYRSKSIKSGENKYILLWKHQKLTMPLHHMNQLNCADRNCYFSEDENMFNGDSTDFDVVMFDQSILGSFDRPRARSSSQLYVFFSVEAAPVHPACEVYNDNYFNWTMTFRLDSVIPYPRVIVRNLAGDVVAPSTSKIIWEEVSDPLPVYLRNILTGKTKAAAWIVNQCNTLGPRNQFLNVLQEHLNNLAIRVDIYGNCTKKLCRYNNNCSEMIKRDYYFYMAFEKVLVEDYITETVLQGYDNYAVPVIFGGADYNRFLPTGSYINAKDFHPYALALTIKQCMDNPGLYERYFRWRNLYDIASTLKGKASDHHPLCKFCAALNQDRAKHAPAMKDFRTWWNSRDKMKWCIPNAETWELEYLAWNKTFGYFGNYNIL